MGWRGSGGPVACRADATRGEWLLVEDKKVGKNQINQYDVKLSLLSMPIQVLPLSW